MLQLYAPELGVDKDGKFTQGYGYPHGQVMGYRQVMANALVTTTCGAGSDGLGLGPDLGPFWPNLGRWALLPTWVLGAIILAGNPSPNHGLARVPDPGSWPGSSVRLESRSFRCCVFNLWCVLHIEP
jgi:hypothetical protein